MRKALLACVVLLALPVLSGAGGGPCTGFEQRMTPIAYESITVANAAIGFTPAKLANASYAFAQLETAPIRYTSDGTAPTSAVGTLMVAGLGLDVCGPEALKAFRAIRTTGNSGTLTVTYYKAGY